MRARLLFGLALVSATGCGAVKYTPVSGTVTMDGKPLAGAVVSFVLIQDKKTGIEAPPAATGKTNEKGEYSLESTTGQPGARVGKYKVSITLVNAQVGDTDERPPRGGWPMKDEVPARYNENTELTFEVPSGGITAANFVLTSK